MAPRLAPGPQLFISLRRFLLARVFAKRVPVRDEALFERGSELAVQDRQARPADIAQPLNSKTVRLGGGKSQLSISFRQHPKRQLVPGNVRIKVRRSASSDGLRIWKNLIAVYLYDQRIFFKDPRTAKVAQKGF